MREYTLPYGRGSQTVSIDERRVLAELRLARKPVIADVRGAVLDALRHPIGCPPLADRVRPGDSVAFICNDPTRVANTFELMPALVDELARLGVADSDMSVTFALGTHRAMTEAEMREHLTDAVYERLGSVSGSDCNDPGQFEYFGATSRFTPVLINRRICHATHVMLTGSVVYHFFAGYGGGRKAVLPGCAAMETIRHNHSLMLDPHAGLGKTAGNPVYEDQMEGVRLWADAMRERGQDVFLLNAVLDDRHRFLKMFAGDYVAAHREACAFVDEVYGVPVGQRADIVIASCGGYPKDINVYQAQKTMDNAVLAVREGGVVVLLAECPEGSGSAVLEETLGRLRTPEAIKAEVARHFVIGAHKAYSITRPMGHARFILVSGMGERLARAMQFSAVTPDAGEALRLADAMLGGDGGSVILMPAGSLTVPLAR